VIIPVIRLAGVTSNAGFQQLIPINTYTPDHVQFRTTMHPDKHSQERCILNTGQKTRRKEITWKT